MLRERKLSRGPSDHLFRWVTRTHYVQIKRRAFPISFRVVSNTSVIACAFTVDALQHQALITDYDTLCDVEMKSFFLQQRVIDATLMSHRLYTYD